MCYFAVCCDIVVYVILLCIFFICGILQQCASQHALVSFAVNILSLLLTTNRSQTL